MTLKEFRALPKRKKSPRQRIRDKIKEIRDTLEIVPSDTEEEFEKRCCGKKTFLTEQDALSGISSRRKNSRRPIRAYKCQLGYWHLSSRTKSQASVEISFERQNN